METRELTCIGCPMGCSIRVTLKNGNVENIIGFTCRRGKEYAIQEVTDPRRIVTSTVRVSGGTLPVVSVKTMQAIPKGKIFECMEALQSIVRKAPVKIGDVILRDVAGTGVDVAATKNVMEVVD